MRLRTEEIAIVKEAVARVLPDAEVFLFGSRADDTKRGGDIDLLIVTPQGTTRQQESAIYWNLQEFLGEQKIDIVYQKQGTLTAFARLAKLEGVRL
ncbi:MAG TPA: nucleotidyltransferase domain-containing protein [Bacteroidota bacterium]